MSSDLLLGERSLRGRLLVAFVSVALLLAGVAAVAETDFEAGADAYHSGDYEAAFAIFRDLAEAGDAKAQTILGLMHSYGEGVRVDRSEALKWYQRAGEQGYNVAQYRLGMLYTQGRGTVPNRAEAIRWFSLAAAGGHPRAKRKLAELGASAHEWPQDSENSPLSLSLSPTAKQAIRAVTDAAPPASAATRDKRPLLSAAETAPVYRVQLAAARSEKNIRHEWDRYKKQYAGVFEGLDGTIERAEVGASKTVWYRLRIGPLPNETAARALCKQVKRHGMKTGCLLVRPDG